MYVTTLLRFGSCAANFSASRGYFQMLDDDAGLVQQCRAGNRDAFTVLVLRHQKTVYNVALRVLGHPEDARDATQNVFLKVFEHLDSFDPRYRFFSWVYRIALNEAMNRRRRRQQSTALTNEEPDGVPGPEAVVAGEQTGKALEDALQRLVAEQREVVVLRHVAELSYEEMAEVLQVPEKTVKSRLHSARMRLRELLADEHGPVGTP